MAVNTAVVAVAEAPFGGIKQTGYGREGGSMAIKDYLNINILILVFLIKRIYELLCIYAQINNNKTCNICWLY